MANEQLEEPRLERLHGINVTDDSIIFFVTSTGCTEKKDFKALVEFGFTGYPLTIELKRITPDVCKMMPHVVELTFSLEELHIKKGGFAVELLNKVGTSVVNL